ncbi:MAG: hypothetical protein SV375_20665, partial [Thermodesulfobacteriota bacterium]|nr:hypothetical protein [Thermodesulfobacteriota bacterium]
ALFWTFAEGLILFYMRWGVLFLRRGEGRQRIFLFFCVVIFLLLFCLMFGGENYLSGFLDLEQGHNLKVYRWALWNFFCTLWVILEGIIMIYVLVLYKTLTFHLKNNDVIIKKEKRQRTRSNITYGIPLLIINLFSLYIFYEYNLISLIENNVIDGKAIYRISLFYIRICGLFWILFEWIVAYVGIKTYRLMKES